MSFKQFNPPIPKARAKYIIELHGLTLTSYGKILGHKSHSAISQYIAGRYPAKRFWEDFFTRFNVRKVS